MKKLEFPLSSYYGGFFTRVDYDSFESLIKLLEAHGFEKEYINVFFECCFISLDTQKEILLNDEALEQIYPYWEKTVGRLGFYRFSYIPSLCPGEVKEIRKIYDAINAGEVEGVTMEAVDKLVRFEDGFALYRMVPKKQPPVIVKNPAVLYGDPENSTSGFKSFAPMDMKLMK